MATLLNILKQNGIALRSLVKPPPIVVYSFHDHYAANMEIFFLKPSRLIFLQIVDQLMIDHRQTNRRITQSMAIHKRKINPEDDLGFGSQPVIKNQPLVNKDGSPNVRRIGLPFFNTANNYHTLITMSWTKFWLLVLSGYLTLNIIFAFIYFSIGPQGLNGSSGITTFHQ